jgi:hypothetical protein
MWPRPTGPAHDTVPRATPAAHQRLGKRFSMRPTKLGQPRHQVVEETGGIRIGVQRPTCRICDVVLGGSTQQRRALTSRVSTRQPAGQRLAGWPRSDPLTAPDEFLQRERPRPRAGLSSRGIPEMVPGHRQHQAGGGQVRRADDAATVRGDLGPVRGHDRDDFRVWRLSAADHPGRVHRQSSAERGQSPGEQCGRHRGPAYVRGAQNDDACRTGIISLLVGGRNLSDALYSVHRSIAAEFSSSAFNENSRESARLPDTRCHGTAPVRHFIAATLVIHSFYSVHARPRRASGGFPVSAAAIYRSERKS